MNRAVAENCENLGVRRLAMKPKDRTWPSSTKGTVSTAPPASTCSTAYPAWNVESNSNVSVMGFTLSDHPPLKAKVLLKLMCVSMGFCPPKN